MVICIVKSWYSNIEVTNHNIKLNENFKITLIIQETQHDCYGSFSASKNKEKHTLYTKTQAQRCCTSWQF